MALKTAKWDRLDGLVCNAGVECVGAFEELQVSQYRRIMDINYFGCVHTVKACLPYLQNNKDKGSRVIVNASLLALMGLMYNSAYCASKFALRGFVESIAMEFRSYACYVSIVYPPDVATDSLKREKSVNVPKPVREISTDSGVIEASVVGGDIARMLESGESARSWGVDGWMLRNLSVGMTAPFSLIDSVTQVLLGGVFRGIAMWYGKEWADIGRSVLRK